MDISDTLRLYEEYRQLEQRVAQVEESLARLVRAYAELHQMIMLLETKDE